MRRVVVTGLGIVSSIGNHADEVQASLRDARSGITFSTRVTATTYDAARNLWMIDTDRGAQVNARFCIAAVQPVADQRAHGGGNEQELQEGEYDNRRAPLVFFVFLAFLQARKGGRRLHCRNRAGQDQQE